MAFSGFLGGGSLGSTFALALIEDPDPTNQNVAQRMFSDVATYDPVFNVFVNQTIFTTQDAEALYRAVSQTMFTDLASPDAFVEVVQFLGFTDRQFAPDTGNVLGWKGVVTVAVIADAANFFFTNPDDDNKVIQAHRADNDLGWADTINPIAERRAENDLGFVDVIAFTGPQSRTIDQGGFLRQTVSIQVDNNPCRELEYDPIIGEGTDGFDTFSTTKPTFTTGTVQFTFPPISPTDTLTLDHPDFGNSDTLHFTRIDRETRGGDRKIFADADWATWERLEFTVSGLCEIDADAIISFLNTTLGKTVRLADWESRTWDGLIVAPETDITNEQAGWRLNIVFEGTQNP